MLDASPAEVTVEAVTSEKPAVSTEQGLRAQIDAKQVLMSVVLKVIFSLQLTEAAPVVTAEPLCENSVCALSSPPSVLRTPEPAMPSESAEPAPEEEPTEG